MTLLVARGADPTIPTTKPATNDRFRQGGTRSADESRDHSGMPPVPTGGPDIPPLAAAVPATARASPATPTASRPPGCWRR